MTTPVCSNILQGKAIIIVFVLLNCHFAYFRCSLVAVESMYWAQLFKTNDIVS